MKLFRRLLIKALRPIAQVLFRVKMIGCVSQDHQRLLIIANHESFLDGILLGLFLPFEPVYVVHTSVKKHWYFRWILAFADHVAVDPTCSAGMKTVINIIESGRPVVVFPEGRITTTGSLMKTYEGPAFVAAKTNATILPIRIDGAARTYFSRLSNCHPRQLFPNITITVLPTTQLKLTEAELTQDGRRKAADQMRRIMLEMIFSSNPRQTLFEAFLSAIEIHGRSRQLIEDIKQDEYTYQDLLKMSLMLGRKICQVTENTERVGVLLPNTMACLGLVFGLTAFRRVPAMLNYTAGTEGIQSACEIACIKTIVTSRLFIAQGRLESLIKGLKDVHLVYLEDIQCQVTIMDKIWLFCWALPFPRAATLKSDAEDIAVTLFTSGTESKPKGVLLSHRAILANIGQIRAVAGLSVDDKFLNVLPFFHSFGLTAGGLLPIICGARLVLYPSPLHYKIIPELAYDRNCTVLLGTSTFLGNYAKYAHPYDFYRLRYVIAGAERLTDSVRELWFEKFGIRIFEGYGATETAPVLAVNVPMAYRSKTVGQLLPGIQAKVCPMPGVDRGGILQVTGPNLMTGYLRAINPCVIEPLETENGQSWYDTGDLVDIDDDGFIHILGRVKRFAKIAGEMVSLETTEALARQASPDHMHAAVTVADPNRGEAIVLFTTDQTLNREKLTGILKTEGGPEIALPRKIMAIDALPLLGTGKTDYVSLTKQAEAA